MKLSFEVVEANVLVLLLLVALFELDPAPVERFVLNHEVLRLCGDILIYIGLIVAHLNLRLRLLKHTQLQTSDLVLYIPVIFLCLAVLDDLAHQLLELIIFHLLCILLISGWSTLLLHVVLTLLALTTSSLLS